MKVTTTSIDVLPHIVTNEGRPSQVNFMLPAVTATNATPATTMDAVSGSYTFFGFLEVDYSLSIFPPEVQLDLYINALGEKVRIAGVDLNPNNPTATIGGSALGFKAELTATFNFDTDILTLQAKGCVPVIGCKSGSTQIHL